MSGLDYFSDFFNRVFTWLDTILYILSAIILTSSIVFTVLPKSYYISGWILITSLGGLYFYMTLTLLIYFLGDSDAAYQIIVTLISSSWINIFFKNIFALPRPSNPMVEVSGYGFPSGHAQVSSTFWTSVTLFYRRRSLFLFSIIMISTISFSRLALNVHYPQDVIGGIIIGFIVALIFIIGLYRVRLSEEYVRIYRLIIGLVIAFSLLTTYAIFINNMIILEFSGFLIGFSLHPILYRKKIERHYRLLAKYLVALIISYICYKFVAGNPLITLITFILNGSLIPIIRFRI